MSSGYSGTPLLKKLGIGPGTRLLLIDAPADLVEPLGPLPQGENPPSADVILLFARSRSALEEVMSSLLPRIAPAGALWVAWPKKSSRVPCDLVEEDLRTLLLPTGLVDNKVCSISEVWSGLRFVVRLERRSTWPFSA